MFWNKKEVERSGPRQLLPGTVVKTEKGYFYIQKNTRLHIPSVRVLKSWSFARVVKMNEADLAGYPRAGKLGFRQGTLLSDISNGVLYIIVNNKAVLVDSPELLSDNGYDIYRDAISCSGAEMALHEKVEYASL